MSLGHFLYTQLIVSLPHPTENLAGKTVIVTGSNVGLGKEAARHITSMGASKVILAVRNLPKGEEAKADILNTTKVSPKVVEVWELDLGNYDSVKAFAAKANKELDRLDILLENAGIATRIFRKAEENESTITVNVVSTFLLAFLLLPKLKETASKHNIKTNLAIVSSGVHGWTKIPERSAPEGQLFAALSDEKTAVMRERYPVSKLLEVFMVREMAERTAPADKYPVVMNTINPGLCHSELTRDGGWVIYFMKLLLARSTEHGSRTLVNASLQGSEAHGQYMSECHPEEPAEFVLSDEGKTLQKRVWTELTAKLEIISPGVTSNL